MKRVFACLITLGVIGIAFSSFNINTTALTFCAALKAVIKEQPAAFETLKGAYISENTDGSKNYASKVIFEGWASSRYGTTEEGGPGIDIKSELTTKTKAKELFTATEKQIGDCLGVAGTAIQAEGIDQFLIFTKDKCDIALLLVTKDGKTYVMISVSKES